MPAMGSGGVRAGGEEYCQCRASLGRCGNVHTLGGRKDSASTRSRSGAVIARAGFCHRA